MKTDKNNIKIQANLKPAFRRWGVGLILSSSGGSVSPGAFKNRRNEV
ncbi:MAG: hypothetical protein WC389_18590 [Lutibacter sp.]|jgi:hypothetical protein